jgi:hypothetical protein
MMTLRIGPDYRRDRAKFEDVLKAERERIAKTVDLFSRIKSTDQAEEVTMVLFASRQLKRADREKAINENELLDYILAWKESWRTEEKASSIRGTIRELVMLSWMKAALNEEALRS